MKNPRFPLSCEVRAVGRAFHVENGKTQEGWTLTLALDANTFLRLFFANATLEVERTIGTSPGKTKTLTIVQRPAVRVGDQLTLLLDLPVLDDS